MTPEERNLVIELFDRLATLEDARRDPEAERLIRDGLQQAPNALYALVQTVLVQDRALAQADARIRELEGGAEATARDTSFLGGMRDSLFGRGESRGSVPSVRPPSEEVPGTSSAWQGARQAMPAGPAPGPAPAPGSMGGSFLGTAAAAAAGVIGGSLLLGGIRNAMGSQQGGHGAFDPGTGAAGSSPWSGGGSGGELSRQAGLGDIGRSSSASEEKGGSEGRHGLLDDRSEDDIGSEQFSDEPDDGDFDGDLGVDC